MMERGNSYCLSTNSLQVMKMNDLFILRWGEGQA